MFWIPAFAGITWWGQRHSGENRNPIFWTFVTVFMNKRIKFVNDNPEIYRGDFHDFNGSILQ